MDVATKYNLTEKEEADLMQFPIPVPAVLRIANYIKETKSKKGFVALPPPLREISTGKTITQPKPIGTNLLGMVSSNELLKLLTHLHFASTWIR